MVKYRTSRDEINQRLSRIETLNAKINSAELNMQALKSNYELTFHERDKMGVFLLDRNDEICIFYERLNIQKSVMHKGEAEIAKRNQEISQCKLNADELTRKISLKRRLIPLTDSLLKELEKSEKLQKSLHNEASFLSAQMENPEDPKRCRHLAGSDSTAQELSVKITKIEAQLSLREVNILVTNRKNFSKKTSFLMKYQHLLNGCSCKA